ncbi:MAG TPA: hypothetical protein VFR80_04065 [Pyrinomonadaceae bacterium]|nr:hypothetical protein [Pyrinomonadaceae bacterium]
MPKCKPFSVNLAVLAPSNKRQVSFGITRGCIDDNTPFYLIIFVLRDKVDGGFQDRVKLDIRVGDTLNSKAEALMTQGLNMSQLEFLSGPITDRAKALKKGTTEDAKLAALNQQLLEIKK